MSRQSLWCAQALLVFFCCSAAWPSLAQSPRLSPLVPVLAHPAGAPQASVANRQTAVAQLNYQDLSLNQNGLLMGQVLDPQGKPIASAKVWLLDGVGQPTAAQTDRSGRFAYQQVKPGVYYLQTGNQVRVCRVWTHRAAPPKSLASLLMVADESTVRAQMGPPTMLNSFVQRSKKFFAHPAGMVTAGVLLATPIAIAASDDDDPPATP